MTIDWTNLPQLVGNALGILFGLAIVFPKVGEAILGRLLSGSLEKQKAEFAQQLETHKAYLLIQIETIRTKNAEEVENFKAALAQKSAQTNKFLEYQQKIRQALRDQLLSLTQQRDIGVEATYFIASQICKNVFINRELLATQVCEAADRLDSYIESPLGLTDSGFEDRVHEICILLINAIDRSAIQ